jgi:outer membrane protein assembly factor BamB
MILSAHHRSPEEAHARLRIPGAHVLFVVSLLFILGNLLSAVSGLMPMATAAGLIAESYLAQIAPTATGPQDWPTFLQNNQRTSATGETILTKAAAPNLKVRWKYLTGGLVAASPTIVGGVLYVGSWDGYEYALNASTGALKWKSFLGQTSDPGCNPPSLGVTSAATVQNGVVYVGGGDSYWYALDATTGNVLWKVYTGDNSQAGAHYNWSSPLIYNGDAYIGIASNCDNPLVQGQVLQVSLSTHQVLHTFDFVPTGQVGGGAWTSPMIDPVSNTIFVTSATQNQASQNLAEAIVALDPNTLALKSSWQVPFSQKGDDSDWGTTPSIVTDANGHRYVIATNKDGILYAFNPANLSAGPVWQRTIALGGACPPCGDGSISSAAIGNGMIFVAGGNTVINGVGYRGSVRAINPSTGNIIWQQGTDQPVFAALTYDNGLVIDAEGNSLEVRDADTGQSLYTYLTGGPMYSAPAIWNGNIYIGSGDKNLYAFTAGHPTPPPPDPNCPPGWTCQDIRSPAKGTETVNANGSWTVIAAGSEIHGTSDQFRYISQLSTGDTQVTAQLLSQSTQGTTPQAGVMIRQSNDPTAPFYAILESPNNLTENQPQPVLRIWYRTSFGGTAIQANKIYPLTLPSYFRIQRIGNFVSASVSTDGVHYHLLPGTLEDINMPAAVMAGVATDSDLATTTGTATYAHVAVGAPGTPPTPPAPPTPCPANWNCLDVGDPSPVGDQSLTGTTWTLQGVGNDIAYSSDQFHFVWQPLAADGTLTAHLTAQGNTSVAAKAGIMLRASLDPGSPYYGIFVTPGDGILIQYRAYSNLRTTQIATLQGSAPQYLRLARWTDPNSNPSTTYYTAYTSTDGTNWTAVPWSTAALNMPGTVHAGMAASAHAPRVYSPVTYDTVSLTNTAPPAPTACPANWSCGDVGYPYPHGNQAVQNGTWSLLGGGDDIWDTYDQFHFVWQSLGGDGTISAHITAQTNTNPWAKAGVMLRASLDPSGVYYAAFLTPGNGAVIQFRDASGAFSNQITIPGTAPNYLKVTRYTDISITPSPTYYTTYTSTDGATWTQVPGSTALLSMPNPLAGLAVTSHNNSQASAVTFDTLSVAHTAPAPQTDCPQGWGCADIGGALPPGDESLSNGTWTVKGGGGDIWGTADSFHLIWQNIAANGMISAHVTAQTNTDPWAKAGVMLRASVDPGSPYYGIFVTPGNGVAIQYRTQQSGNPSQVLISGAVPQYLRVARYTDTSVTPNVVYFTAYTSKDGVTWTEIPGSTTSFAMTGTLLAGLAVTSHNMGTLSTATIDSVAIANTAPAPAEVCVTGWACTDIGNPLLSGGQTLNNGTWTVVGAGGDIWGTADQFHLVSQSLSGDGTVSGHVTAQTNTDPWAKTGVMLRASLDPGAVYYGVFVTPGNGVVVQFRTQQGGTTNQIASSGIVPVYLRVGRVGATFTAYTSSDGITWTPIANSSVTLTMGTTSLAGLAVTSHNPNAQSTATFDSVSP